MFFWFQLVNIYAYVVMEIIYLEFYDQLFFESEILENIQVMNVNQLIVEIVFFEFSKREIEF